MASSDRGAAETIGPSTGRHRRLTTRIPLTDPAAQHRALERPIREAMARMLETSKFVLGEEVEAFEREFAAFLGVKHAVGVASGLDALVMTLRALEIGKGAEVLLPANGFVSTPLAVATVGAKPVFVDVDPERYTIDPALAARAVTKKTKAIIPIHLYGQAAGMEALRELANSKGLFLIEDASEAHGASLNGVKVGMMSDAACFSFFPSMPLGALGDGGMVVTERDDLNETLRLQRNLGEREKYVYAVKGVNSRLDAVQAAVLRVKLRHLTKWNEARRRHAGHYAQALGDSPVATPTEAQGAVHVYHRYVVRAPRREDLMRHLDAVGITTGIHYPVPSHKQLALAEFAPAEPLTVTERLAKEILSLPMYPEMADSDVDAICSAVAAFYAQPAAIQGV